MDPLLTATRLPPARKRGDIPRWDVTYDGQHIGYVEEGRIGHRIARPFWKAFVDIQGQTISLESSGDFDDRVESILAAWLDPASSLHVPYWLRL